MSGADCLRLAPAAARWVTRSPACWAGVLAPIISTALLDWFGTRVAVSLYAAAMLLITIAAVVAAPETSRIDLHSEQREERAIVEPGR